MQGREIVVGVTGGIAAFKTAALVSQLVQGGAGVTVAMTEAAQRFVGAATFAALTGRAVARDVGHRAEDVHRLRPRDARHRVHRQRRDRPPRERGDQFRTQPRLQQPDQGRAVTQPPDLRVRRGIDRPLPSVRL